MPLAPLLTALVLAAAPFKLHVAYTLRVDPADFSSFAVRMRVTGAPAVFTIAANAHPEYDDKYWRYLEDMRVDGGTVERLDSVRWRVHARAGGATVSWRIRPPVVEGRRFSWRDFLTRDGGLLGGPGSFLYLVGGEAARAEVTLELPADWRVATSLDSTGPRAYVADDVARLMDSPIVVGPTLSVSRFMVSGVPHDVVYWGPRDGTPFDTAAFRAGVERLARAVVGF